MATRSSTDLDALLRTASRSFYLSIRLLPARLRRPVGLAYLLARASDTVADTAAVPVAQRQAMLACLGDAFQLAGPTAELAGLADAFARRQSDPQEQALIHHLNEALAQLSRLNTADLRDVQAVLSRIVDGQTLDLRLFPASASPHAMPDAATLNAYTYLVAGCVGEFWTDLCVRHLAGYAQLAPAEMRALGRSFGCGLQLVNIVRDVGADLAAGRCYFPADELAAAGIAPQDILADPARFAPVWQRWQEAADAGLQDGLAYALAVRPRRARMAAALPALLGARTLALLQAAGPAGLVTRIKVPRRQVHGMLARTVLTLAARDPLQRHFAQLRPGQHPNGWDNPA